MPDEKKPITIEELEAILNGEDDHDIRINPDGTVTATPRPVADVLPFRKPIRATGQY